MTPPKRAGKGSLQCTMKRKAGNQKNTFHLTVQGHSLEVQRIVGRSRSTAEIVLLHEGPGSISYLEGFSRCQSHRICR